MIILSESGSLFTCTTFLLNLGKKQHFNIEVPFIGFLKGNVDSTDGVLRECKNMVLFEFCFKIDFN